MRQTTESIDMALADGEQSSLWAVQRPAENRVVLADGSVRALDGLARDELLALQWQQEREFARANPRGAAGLRGARPSDAPGL